MCYVFLQLINKNNQFNTTGKRSARAQLVDAMTQGVRVLIFDVEDRLSAYGLVGVLIIDGGVIEQLVMSCRVIGLGVEIAAVLHAVAAIGQAGHASARAIFTATDANHLCADLYRRCNFADAMGAGKIWELPVAAVQGRWPPISRL